MDIARPIESKKLLTLQEAALKLAVSVDVLLQWNEHNILKPTITPTGEVGYREEQINKFLGIRQLTQPQPNYQPNQIPVVQHEPTVMAPTHFQKDYGNLQHIKLEQANFPRARSKYFSIGPTSAALTLGVALVIILITQPAKIESLLNEANNMGKALSAETSKFNLSKSISFIMPKSSDSSKNLSNVGQIVLENKLTALNTLSGKKTGKTTLAANNKVSQALLGASTQNGQVSSFASSPTTNQDDTTSNSVFDNGGNIKGKTTNVDILATSLGVNGMMQNNGSIKQVIDLNIPLAILTLSLLSLLFIFKKQLAFPMRKQNSALGIDPHNFISDVDEPRVLEVDQKTDGTVVLYFQGKEYKVCKPELDSESDQFIERLMGLVQENIKEIDYDSFKDNEIRLSAPLSKLVTRLGFVGIKRDLFFPRTSKNRVLFRRYLTKQDLISMNLTTEQISSEFLNFSQS